MNVIMLVTFFSMVLVTSPALCMKKDAGPGAAAAGAAAAGAAGDSEFQMFQNPHSLKSLQHKFREMGYEDGLDRARAKISAVLKDFARPCCLTKLRHITKLRIATIALCRPTDLDDLYHNFNSLAITHAPIADHSLENFDVHAAFGVNAAAITALKAIGADDDLLDPFFKALFRSVIPSPAIFAADADDADADIVALTRWLARNQELHDRTSKNKATKEDEALLERWINARAGECNHDDDKKAAAPAKPAAAAVTTPEAAAIPE